MSDVFYCRFDYQIATFAQNFVKFVFIKIVKKIILFVCVGMLVSLFGCASVPESIVQTPTTAKPQQIVAAMPANGAI